MRSFRSFISTFLYISLIYSKKCCIGVGTEGNIQVNNEVQVDPESIVIQPCMPYDTCQKRCIAGPQPKNANVTLGQFNCYCDDDCKIFGDCCWDYLEECDTPLKDEEASPRKEVASPLPPRDDSFECVVVDEFSKGSFWMVTRCADDWGENEMARKCHEVGEMAFDSNLPVLGDTGWTYRNAFCAQCNYVTKYYYWALKASCIQSAPEEVLSGDPEMLSFYLEHFCMVRLQQDATFNEERSLDMNDDKWESLAWKKSLRPCVQDMIDDCPPRDDDDNHDDDDDYVFKMCRSYQSVVIKPGTKRQQSTVYKNPFCASCHGVDSNIINKPSISNSPQEKIADIPEEHASTGPDLVCPVWFLSTYYDNTYWKLDAAHQSNKFIRSFNTNCRKSSWVPPSFSILMRFSEEDDVDMTYHEGSSTVVSIPAQQSCSSNEIYDPFVGICRPVVCINDMVYTESGCLPNPNAGEGDQAHSGGPSSGQLPHNAVTITISITIPVSHSNQSTGLSASDVGELLVKAFETAFNTNNSGNITVRSRETRSSDNSTALNSPGASEGTMDVSISFVILKPGNYTNEEIVKFVEWISETTNFEKLVMDMDSYSVLVLEYAYPKNHLVCEDEGSSKVQYTSEEYELSEFDGRKLIYINQTDSYYSEGEFQLLDWVISVNENGVESNHVEESRALICILEASTLKCNKRCKPTGYTSSRDLRHFVENGTIEIEHPPLCNLYTPLNSSEYRILENGSLYLERREIILTPDHYISFGDGYAICLDGYTTPPTLPPRVENVLMSPVDVIISWIAFGLTIFSLTSLCFTFVTYCIFSELRTVAGCSIMNLTMAMFAALLLFSFGISLVDPPELCMAVAIMLHYLFLSTFFWNNIMAYDVWSTFGKGIQQAFRMSTLGQSSVHGRSRMIRRTVLKYMLYGWGFPAIVVGACIAVEFGFPQLEFGYRFDRKMMLCWISNTLSNVLAFGVPLALILLINAVFFTLSIASIHRMSTGRRRNGSLGNNRTFKHKSQRGPPSTPNRSSSNGSSRGKHFSNRIANDLSATANDDVFTFAEDAPDGREARKKPEAPPLKKPRPRRLSTTSIKTSLSSARVSIFLYVKMSTVMGFTWFIGFFSALFPDVAPLRYIFEILVPLQGFFIFVAFICKRRIYELYKGLACRRKKLEKNTRERSTTANKSNTNSAVTSAAQPQPESHARILHLQSRFQARVRSCSSSDSLSSFNVSNSRRISIARGITNLTFENEFYSKSRLSSQSRSSSESSGDNA